jgi:hypothetical protein
MYRLAFLLSCLLSFSVFANNDKLDTAKLFYPGSTEVRADSVANIKAAKLPELSLNAVVAVKTAYEWELVRQTSFTHQTGGVKEEKEVQNDSLGVLKVGNGIADSLVILAVSRPGVPVFAGQQEKDLHCGLGWTLIKTKVVARWIVYHSVKKTVAWEFPDDVELINGTVDWHLPALAALIFLFSLYFLSISIKGIYPRLTRKVCHSVLFLATAGVVVSLIVAAKINAGYSPNIFITILFGLSIFSCAGGIILSFRFFKAGSIFSALGAIFGSAYLVGVITQSWLAAMYYLLIFPAVYIGLGTPIWLMEVIPQFLKFILKKLPRPHPRKKVP